SANPSSYVELTFNAVAGQKYHFWMRGRADSNVYTNDSVFVQFSNAVTSTGTPIYRPGTTSAAEYNLEDCSSCGIAGWGWQDNGWGSGVMGAAIYFDTTGPQTLRLQQREDGLSIDQIILSPAASSFLNASPGALKNDIKIYAATQGSMAGSVPTAPPPPATAPLPSPWQHADIGSVGVAGSANYDGSTAIFTVKGAGADVWGTQDALHFVYQSLTGDGSIVARVASVSNTAAWVKAGVMIRDTLDANSAQAMMLVSYSKGLAFQRRTAAGGLSTSTSGALSGAPYYVRLDRSGSTISAFQSSDGVNWTLVGIDTFSMTATVYVGIGVSSHSTAATATATFDNITATAGSEG
ncbi:MAG: hypothetical protein ABI603_12425, partial [Acidobacteriota bacterium]